MTGSRGYAVGVIAPPGYVHGEALREVALTVHAGLARLGRDSILADNLGAPERRNIVLGAHLLGSATDLLPPDAVIYNLEQVAPDSPWFSAALLDLLKNRPVWDYSTRNIAALGRLGIRGARHVPIGYCPGLTRPGAAVEDIDVIFFGSINPRRAQILDALRARGARVEARFGVYGAERDALAARAKVVLNVHYYESRVFEVVRVSHMLALGRFVVSEYGADLDEEGEFSPGVAFAEYDELVDTCIDYLGRPAERAKIARQGLALMSARDETRFLMPALTELESAVPQRRASHSAPSAITRTH